MKNWHFSNFYFFYFITIGIIVPYWSLYLQHLNFSATQIGELMAILQLTKIVAPNIWASIADHLAIKNGNSLGILKIATLASWLIFLLIGLVEHFWPVALVMISFCVFLNASLPQVEAATLNHLGGNRENYGRIRLWGSIGFIICVLGVGRLIDLLGPSVIYPVAAISFFTLFVASLLFKNRQTELSQYQDVVSPINSDKIPLRQLLNRRVIVILMLCFLMQLSHAPFYTFFSIYLQGYGYSKLLIGQLWSIGVIFEIGVFLFGYRLFRRFDLAHLLIFTFFSAAIRWYLLAQYPDNTSMMFISQILHAVTYGLYHSVMIQVIDRLFQGRYQIRGQALYTSFTFGLGGALGSIGSGYIWTYYGQNTLFLGASILMLVVAVMSIVLVRNFQFSARA